MADQPQSVTALSKTERREYQVGVLAAIVLAAVFIFTAMANRGPKEDSTTVFTLSAAYRRADGVHIGTPVRVAGMNIGTVSAASLDEHQRAVLTFSLTQPVQLPDDTAAVIETDGIFGAKYIEFRPGGSDDLLKSGARMSYVQDSVIIEDLVALIVRQAKGAHGVVDPDTAPEATPSSEQKPEQK